MTLQVLKDPSWKSIIIFLSIFALVGFLVLALAIITDLDKRLDELESRTNMNNDQVNTNFSNRENFDRQICEILELDCVWESKK